MNIAFIEALVLDVRNADLDPVLRVRPALLEGPAAINVAHQACSAASPAGLNASSAATPTRKDERARLRPFFGIGGVAAAPAKGREWQPVA